MLGGAYVLGLELVGTGFAQCNARGGKLELGFLDDGSLDHPAGGTALRGTALRGTALRGTALRGTALRGGGGRGAGPSSPAARGSAGTRTPATAREHESEHEGKSCNRECALHRP